MKNKTLILLFIKDLDEVIIRALRGNNPMPPQMIVRFNFKVVIFKVFNFKAFT